MIDIDSEISEKYGIFRFGEKGFQIYFSKNNIKICNSFDSEIENYNEIVNFAKNIFDK